MGLETLITLNVDAKHTAQAGGGIDRAIAHLQYAIRLGMPDGVGFGDSDMMWHDQRTRTDDTPELLDLSGSLTNSFGETQTFVRITAALFFAARSNLNNVEVINAPSNGVALFMGGASAGVSLPPGGCCFLFSGLSELGEFPVTPATADILSVTNSGAIGAVAYDIIIIGTSA